MEVIPMPQSIKTALIVAAVILIVFTWFLTAALCKASSIATEMERQAFGSDQEEEDLQTTMNEYRAKQERIAARKAKRNKTSAQT